MTRMNHMYLCLAAASMLFILCGCETVPKKFREEASGIKTKVATLESRVDIVEARQAEAERQVSEHDQALEEMRLAKVKAIKTNVLVKHRLGKSRGRIKEIQTCLKNAGFYNEKIDGIKGPATRRAIKEFQKANGLKPDGVVGRMTWELLSRYSSEAAEGTARIEEEWAAK